MEQSLKKKYETKKCPHGKIKYRCRDCCGGAYCQHNRRREHCKDCEGSSICEHSSKITILNCKPFIISNSVAAHVAPTTRF